MAGNNDYTFVIGLDSSQFDSGLKETQRKLKAAMEQFEREKSLVKIRADIDIAGLDATADKTKILEIQEKALNDTLDLQRQKLQAASAAYNLIADSQGKQAAASQKLELTMEKERLKVVQLEKELEKLERSATDVEVDIKVDDSGIDIPKIEVPDVEIKVDTSGAKTEIRNAGKTIKSEIDKLSREQTLIQLRGQVQLEGLDEAASSAEKLKLQEEALTAQIDLQKEKIALLSKSYADLVQAQGQNSDAAQIMAMQLEKEQLAMLRLQQQTADLSKQQEIALGINWEMLGLIEPAIKGIDAMIAAGRTIPIPHAKVAAAAAVALSAIAVGTAEATEELHENNPAKILADDFKDIEPDIAESFARISDDAERTSQDIRNNFEESTENVSSSLEETADSYADYFDDALSIIEILIADTENLGDALGVVNDRLPYFNTEMGRIAAIAVGLQKTFSELSESAIKFAQPAVDGFKEVQKQANELYLSLSKAQEIGSFINLSGGEYDDVRDYIRGIQDAVIKGGADDPEVLALEKYGVAIQDAKGHLLEFDEALENVYQGYLKAKEAGEAEAYIIMTNGQSIHDVATFLENYGKAKERANQIKWSTSDFDSLAELSTNLKMAEVQTGEFESALSGLAVPLANLAAESNFEFFKKLTEIIEENRDTILLWEFAAIEAFKSGKESLIDFANSAIDKVKELNDSFGVTDKIKGFIGSLDETFGVTDKLNDLLSSDTQADKDTIFDKAKKDLDAYNAANEKSREETKKNIKDAEALTYSLNRIAKYKEEIADIKIDLQFGDDEYRKSLAKLEQWRQTALKDARKYEDEQAVIAEEYALKREQIERQHLEEIENARKESLDRAEDLMREAADLEFEATHSAFEKQLKDIEDWKQAQLEKASTAEEVAATIKDAAIKEADAFEKEVDRMRGKIESAQDRLARLTLSQRDNDIYQAQKQYYQDLKDLPKEFADAIYNAEIEAIKKREKEDTGGNYTKRPNATPQDDTYYQLLDFTKNNKQLEANTAHLIKLDAEQEAYNEALKNARAGIEDVERSVDKAKIPLTELTSDLAGAESATEQTIQQFQDTADTAKDLGDTLKDADTVISKNKTALKGATSATNTFEAALKKNAQIRAQNQEKFSLPTISEPEKKRKIDIQYGDEPQQKSRGIKILYGDEDDFETKKINDEIPVLYSKFANLGEATEDLTADINSVNVDSLEGVNEAAEKVAQSLAQVGNIDLQNFLTDLQTAITPSTEKFSAFDTALDSVTTSLQKAAEKINGLNFQLAAQSQQQQQNSTQGDTVDMALDATQTGGKIASLAGSIALLAGRISPQAAAATAIIGGTIETLADIAQQARNIKSDSAPASQNAFSNNFATPNDNQAFQNFTTAINEATTALSQMPVSLQDFQQKLQDFNSAENLPTFEAFNFGLDNATTALDTFSNSLLNFNLPAENNLPQVDTTVFSQMSQQLSELTQTAGNIAQSAQAIQQQSKQPPQITVSPVINVNLGGAYVFDNAMKKQLTDDITSNVANAVTDAVSKATSKSNYGYGN